MFSSIVAIVLYIVHASLLFLLSTRKWGVGTSHVLIHSQKKFGICQNEYKWAIKGDKAKSNYVKPREGQWTTVRRLGRNLSDCPSLQGTQCRGVPSSMQKGDRLRAWFCGEGILSSLVAFVPVG